MNKRLVIRNEDKVGGWVFHNRFILKKIVESDTNYRWGFIDEGSKLMRIIWIELNRNGVWDDVDKKWLYRLNYPNIPASEHRVSAEWWGDLENVKRTFARILERCL